MRRSQLAALVVALTLPCIALADSPSSPTFIDARFAAERLSMVQKELAEARRLTRDPKVLAHLNAAEAHVKEIQEHLSPATRPACGERFCEASEYCSTGIHGAPGPNGSAESFAVCTPLPQACHFYPTCDCLKKAGIAFTTCDDRGGRVSMSSLQP